MNVRISSRVVPASETRRAPQNPSSMLRRTSWRIAASFSDLRSDVYEGMITLHAPWNVSLAQALASPLVYSGCFGMARTVFAQTYALLASGHLVQSIAATHGSDP